MGSIGIVGAGIAGVHLALYLQQQGIPATLYAERTPDAHRASRLSSTPGHFGNTIAREAALGVNYWDAPEAVATHVIFLIGQTEPLSFRARFDVPSHGPDHREYIARLLETYLERGGQARFGPVTPAAIPVLADDHALVVVAAGRGGLADLFPVIPERSPLQAPARILCAAQYHGVTFQDGMNYVVHIVPGVGELFDVPMNSVDGPRMGFNFEAIPGGPLETLVRWPYDRDPAGFNQEALRVLREYFPAVYARVSPPDFGVMGPMDILQGAIRPCVRRPYALLPNGRWAVAIGDAHAAHDPVIAQGVNAASAGAFILGDLIREDDIFDERFCHKLERRLWTYMEDVTAWALAVLDPPPPHVLDLFAACASNQQVADQFASFYSHPHQAWDAWCAPERTAALLRRFGIGAPPAADDPVPDVARQTADTTT